MFQKLKRLFHKVEKKALKPKNINSIHFQDIALQDILVEIQPDGNSTLLCLTNTKTNNKIVVDKEKAIVLNAVIAEYANMNNFNRLVGIFDTIE